MAHKKQNKQWIQRHLNDPYVKEAQKKGYRSRAVFKLLEIQAQDKLIESGMVVIDLGAAPGGWSQIAKKLVKDDGRIIALDILEMEPLSGVEFIQGDFTEPEVLAQLLDTLNNTPVDLVLSDMAPNISGNKSIDQPRVMYLVELCLDLAEKVLKPGGDMLVKIFQGAGFDEFLKQLREKFDKILIRKPKSSRPSSREVYLVAKGYKDGSV